MTPLQTKSRRTPPLTLGLALLVLVTRAVFVYANGMPESDSVVMAAGMAKGMGPDVGLGDATLYGRQLSPAIYAFVDAAYPLIFESQRHIIGFLNWMAVAAAALMVLPLVSLLRDHMPDHAVAGTVLVAAFSPVVWEWGTYFHPLVPSVLFLLIAMVAARRADASLKGGLWLLATFVCSAASLVIRAEVLFVVPAIIVWSVLSPRRRIRHLSIVLSTTVFSFITYLLVLSSLPQAEESETHGLASYASMIYHMYLRTFSIAGVTRSIGWAGFSIGAGTLLAAGFGLWQYLGSLRRLESSGWNTSHALVVSGLVWVLPALLFWLPQPTPIMRHYVLPALGLSWVVGYLVLRALPPRRGYMIAVAIVLFNLAVPEVAYRSYNAARPEREKFPHGAFFYQQQVQRESIARYSALADEVVGAIRGGNGVAVLGNWTGYAYVLYDLYASGFHTERVAMMRRNPNVTLERFVVDGEDVRIVQGIRLSPNSPPARDAHDHLEAALGDGLRVFVPREVARAGFTSEALGAPVSTY